MFLGLDKNTIKWHVLNIYKTMKPLHSSLSYLSISLLFPLLLHFGDFLTWVEASNNGHISVHIESKNASVLHHGNRNNKNESGSSTNGHNSTTPKKSQVDEDVS